MPLHRYFKINELTSIWIWRADEPLAFFTDSVGSNSNHDITHPKRMIESSCSKFMISKYLGVETYQSLNYDAYGKPWVQGKQQYISISHSFPFIAVVSSDRNIGFDIQRYDTKLHKIAQRFLSDEESNTLINNSSDPTVELCRLWCVKEAVYKHYGKKQIIFKEQIKVRQRKKDFIALLINKDETSQYTVHTETDDDYAWAIAYIIIN